MNIIEYDNKYIEDVKDLLVELEEYIVSIDKDNVRLAENFTFVFKLERKKFKRKR